MPNDEEGKKAAALHKFAAEALHNEVERFWKRSLFFWGFIAAAFVGYGVMADKDEGIAFAISGFGIVCSIAWTLANRGSKYWQDQWVHKLKSTESAALGREIFAEEDETITERGLWGGKRYSVTKLTIATSDFTALVWFVLAYKVSPFSLHTPWRRTTIVIAAITVGYIIALFIGGHRVNLRCRLRGWNPFARK